VITETTIDGEEEAEGAVGGFHLLVMSAEYFASHSLPSPGSVTIGRSSRCGIRIEDSMASREHARISVADAAGGPAISIEDLGSANGTRVRDVTIGRGEVSSIVPGDGVIIGGTVVMVLPNGSSSELRRLWSHAYLCGRLDEECLRAGRSRTPITLARLRFAPTSARTRILPVLARSLTRAQGVAAYGPHDYEVLFADAPSAEVDVAVETLLAAFRHDGVEVRCAVAWYPKNGKTADALLASANGMLRSGPDAGLPVAGAAPGSAGMKRVRELAARVASSQINILIQGETGVGKDVLARMIHGMSPRADKPFLALNCAGLTETFLESELFGYAKGTFTGATNAKVGLLETADGGTVFLDEIGEMPMTVQAKVLRVIEDHAIRPLGTTRSRTVNVRFLSATNKDLESAVARSEFRQDLLFRLNGMSLEIPPLRQRRDEIPALATLFITDAAGEMGLSAPPAIGDGALEALLGHGWKGNIRELKNVIERALVLCDGPEILAEHLELRPAGGTDGVPSPAREADSSSRLPTLTDPQKLAERQRILDALDTCAANQTRAAQLLGMSRRTFISKLDYYQIPRPQKGAAPTELTRTVVAPAAHEPDGPAPAK
jgi:DNA-binding NtrC family response regulator